jgi:hypothetical protein
MNRRGRALSLRVIGLVWPDGQNPSARAASQGRERSGKDPVRDGGPPAGVVEPGWRKTFAEGEDIFSWEAGAEVAAWPEPVDGAALLVELRCCIDRHVVLGKSAAETLALWVVHTYGFQLRDVNT